VIAHLKHAIQEPFAGGLEMHTRFLCASLRQRGHEVTLFAATGSEPEGLESISNAMQMGVASFPAEHRVYRKLMYSLRGRRFDVIHNNSLHYLPVAMSGGLSAPMVTTLHTPPFWELEGAMRLSDTAHHCYVAVSQMIRRAWQPINDVKRVIANGIDLDQFAFRATPELEPYGVWYGRIVPEKGLHLAIEAARAAGLPLRFAGPISDPEYFAASIRPHLGAAVVYLGHLPHAALAAVIAGARVFLCTPLWDEPYGLVVAESLSCGTPVAAFARGAIPELLDESSGVLAVPGDVGALADAALLAAGLSRLACRRRAESVCDSRAMIDAYERLYHSLLQDHSRPSFREAAPGDVQTIAPERASLIDLYRRRVPSMSCELPAPALRECPV